MIERLEVDGPLSAAEWQELNRCEEVIERGMQAFVEVGNALLAIQEERLYRATHTTFDAYCREKWNMSRFYAHRLMEASAVVENLLPMGNILPANERQARELAALPANEQPEAWAEVIETAAAGGVTAAQVRAVVERRIQVTARRDPALAAERTPPLPAGKFSLIAADPPWRYAVGVTSSRNVEGHYPTLETAAICRLPVGELAAPDAVLFLWTTSPLLQQAFAVLAAWGFSYRTGMVWVKDRQGMGFYARQQHEHLLIATRGEPGAPAPAARPSSIITAPRGRHSEKPAAAYALMEQMYPDASRLELFARAGRPGWTAWGNEVLNTAVMTCEEENQ